MLSVLTFIDYISFFPRFLCHVKYSFNQRHRQDQYKEHVYFKGPSVGSAGEVSSEALAQIFPVRCAVILVTRYIITHMSTQQYSQVTNRSGKWIS